ncbi:MAG: amylo-alpha-1,6-glucosidase [Anaerolineae bacterium]|nr:amylo-alpha-1,6-glucosidase [Anaerolineae bacterium]
MRDEPEGLPSVISFGREVCGDLAAAEQREWLVTNGLGGYASGTVAGLLTRRYHGLLVAALPPPHGRWLLLTRLDETATYEGQAYALFSNRWTGGQVEPAGYRTLERFHLEGTTPVWSYALQDALLEKRIWMEPGANTTYVRYDLRRGAAPLTLSVKAIVNHRDHHGNTRAGGWQPEIEAVPGGLRVGADLYLLGTGAVVATAFDWYRGYWLAQEAYRGLDAFDDNLYAGQFEVVLSPGDSWTLVATAEEAALRSAEPDPGLDGRSAYARRQAHEAQLLGRSGLENAPDRVRQLVLAADQFVVRRAVGDDPDGRSIIAGYHWFADWGRDTMIALPGLTLATGRPELAATILRTYAAFVDQGMLPNRFPERGEALDDSEYNTVDATLWYFEAIRAYYAATEDDTLVRDLYPVLQEFVRWHLQGTRYGIHVDPADGLLYSGEEGVQLTWMDAKVGDWVVTPRSGKAVEINALWYNALRVMADFAHLVDEPADQYEALASKVQASFGRFWTDALGYCYDVVDGPDGDDASLRPNQLLTVSLHHSPLGQAQQRAIVDVCGRHLLASHGLRSLSPGDPAYVGHYGGDQRRRDGAYHQGTVWAWLIGPFVSAHLRVYGDRALARSYLVPLLDHLSGGCVGSISEIFDGDPPFAPRGAIAQAWSVAEVLRAWRATDRMKEELRT